MKSNTNKQFAQVSYRHFRQILNDIPLGNTGDQGADTFICDHQGEVHAVVRAASIDTEGRCHPARYYVKTASLQSDIALAA